MEGYCTLNTDASVKGDVGGYAIWIVSDVGRLRRYGRFRTPVSDANLAEMMADILWSMCQGFPTIYAKPIKGHTQNTSARHVVNRWCDEYARRGRLGL